MQFFNRREAVTFNGFDQIGIERAAVGGLAERPVIAEATGAAGDLGHLGGGQAATSAAIKLAALGEGDMVDIHVQPHADGVGCDQKIDLAGLVELDLGVAGAR